MEVYKGFYIMFLGGCSSIHRINDIQNTGGREHTCKKHNETTLLSLRYSFIQQIYIQLLSSTVVEHGGISVKNINDTFLHSKKIHWLS